MDKGSDVLAQALGTFMEEAGELLAQMEDILLRAENEACSEDDLNALFRCAQWADQHFPRRRRSGWKYDPDTQATG